MNILYFILFIAAPKPKRRFYVSDPDACRMCRHGQSGCPGAKHLGRGKGIACLGYFPAMEQV